MSRIVILDNGHGNNTPGKRSPKGLLAKPNETALFEFEFNRDIVCRIINQLNEKGVFHIKLVPEEYDVSLRERVSRVNTIVKENPENDYFVVSIHANAGGGKGWEVFTSVGQTESDNIAEIFFKNAEKAFPDVRMRSDDSDGDSDKEAQFYILRKTICPAILTENFFMDTEQDLKIITSDKGRQDIADLHVKSILEYINA